MNVANTNKKRKTILFSSTDTNNSCQNISKPQITKTQCKLQRTSTLTGGKYNLLSCLVANIKLY